jgi:hypothetical protein
MGTLLGRCRCLPRDPDVGYAECWRAIGCELDRYLRGHGEPRPSLSVPPAATAKNRSELRRLGRRTHVGLAASVAGLLPPDDVRSDGNASGSLLQRAARQAVLPERYRHGTRRLRTGRDLRLQRDRWSGLLPLRRFGRWWRHSDSARLHVLHEQQSLLRRPLLQREVWARRRAGPELSAVHLRCGSGLPGQPLRLRRGVLLARVRERHLSMTLRRTNVNEEARSRARPRMAHEFAYERDVDDLPPLPPTPRAGSSSPIPISQRRAAALLR